MYMCMKVKFCYLQCSVAARESASVLVVIEVADVNDNAPVLETPQYSWAELANVIVATVDADAPALTTIYTLEVG